MRVGNIAGFGNTGVTAICDFAEDTGSILGFLPEVHEGGYVKSEISFISLLNIAEYGRVSNTSDFSMIDLAHSLIGEMGSKEAHYEQRGLGEKGHLENRRHMLSYISREKLLSVATNSLKIILDSNNLDPDSLVELVDESDVIKAFHKFSLDVLTELTCKPGLYSDKKHRALFFKNDPPASRPDISCKIHEFTVLICRPPSDTTYDLLKHYNMAINESNIDWHISVYHAMIQSFLTRAYAIPTDRLASKLRMIEFPVFITSPQARSELISFVLGNTPEPCESFKPSNRKPKFDPELSKKNIGHGACLPPNLRDKVDTILNPIYHELLDFCKTKGILIQG